MVKNYWILPALAAVALLSNGCVKEEDKVDSFASSEIRFSLTESKAFDEPDTDSPAQTKSFEITGEDGMSIPVVCETSPMDINLGEINTTKAQRYGDEEDFRTETFHVYSWDEDGKTDYSVSYDSGNSCWTAASKKYWTYPTMTFAAVYPEGGCTFSDLKSDKLDFSYTTKASAADQKDLMLAYYSGKVDDGSVSLSFTHALTCINFRAGDLDEVLSIDEISLDGVYAEGTCAVTEAKNPTYTWNPTGSTVVTSSGDPVAAADFSTLEDNADYNFLLIPQNAKDQSVTLTVKVTTANGQISLSAKLDDKTISTAWAAGEKNTFVLSSSGGEVKISVDDKAEGNIKSDLKICNTGTATAYFRVALIGNWCTEQGVIMDDWDVTQGTFTGDFPGANWKKIGDYYYYLNPVDKADDESTPTEIADLLFSEYTAPSTPPVEGTVLNLNVAVQAVRYDKQKTKVTSAWGEDVAKELNTK